MPETSENWLGLITMTSLWARWHLKSPASRLFTQPFIEAQIKENFKAPPHWPLCEEFTGDRWIPRTKGQWRGKCFHLMMSSCCKQLRLFYLLLPARPVIFTRYWLPYTVDFKAPGELWNPQSETVLSKCSFVYSIKDQQTYEMTVKLKSTLRLGPVNVFPNFLHCSM